MLVHNTCVAKAAGQKSNHGNSLDTDKPTITYQLVDKKDTNIIKKIGETTRGEKRYTQKFYRDNNLVMNKVGEGTKRDMRILENKLLHGFFDTFDKLPELNKVFR